MLVFNLRNIHMFVWVLRHVNHDLPKPEVAKDFKHMTATCTCGKTRTFRIFGLASYMGKELIKMGAPPRRPYTR